MVCSDIKEGTNNKAWESHVTVECMMSYTDMGVCTFYFPYSLNDRELVSTLLYTSSVQVTITHIILGSYHSKASLKLKMSTHRENNSTG